MNKKPQITMTGSYIHAAATCCAVLAGLLVMSGCTGYLDEEKYFRDLQTEERIFSKKDYSEQWLAACYNMLLGDNLEAEAHRVNSVTNFSDDMVFNEGLNEGRRGSLFRSWKLGEYQYIQEEMKYFWRSWQLSYAGIRQASILIHNIDINEELTPAEITDMKGQARFVRAYLYWLLLKKYGPCPIMPDEGADYSLSYEEISYPRMPYDSVANYIAREMEQAARELPMTRTVIGAGRPTRGAALALRAKVLIYAASPLANGNAEMADFTDNNGRPLISQTYDERKWARAAAACRDLIDYSEQNGQLYQLHIAYKVENSTDYAYPQTIEPPYHPEYSEKKFPDGWADIDPFESYRSEFNGDALVTQCKDIIFSRVNNVRDNGSTASIANNTRLASHQLPASCGGWNCHGLTQKQVDAYAMADGTPFDTEHRPTGFTTAANAASHPYDHLGNNVSMQYANREPRFYASVGFSGDYWACTSANNQANRNVQVFYYRGLMDGRQNASERWQLTGISMKKFVNPADCMVDGGTMHVEVEPTIRYADILLLYAEALNELTTSHQMPSLSGQTYTVSRDETEMRRAIKPIRMRAGVPEYAPEVFADRDLLRRAIKHERQIEFLGESQRYYDLRRWKDAPQEEGTPIYGCNVNMNSAHAAQFYVPTRITDVQSNFSPRMYFWPVLKSELRRNANLTQAPGWETYD